MFAVIKTGGKQYSVRIGDVLEVEKLDVEKGNTVTFEEVLLVEDDGNTLIGTPLVDKAQVSAVVVESFKGEKVIVFKKKRRKQYKKTRGHRQELTRVKIESIVYGDKVPAKAKPVAKTEPVKDKEAAPETKPISEPEIKAKVQKAEAKESEAKKAAPKKAAAKKAPAATTEAKKTAKPKSAETAKSKAKKTEAKAKPKVKKEAATKE